MFLFYLKIGHYYLMKLGVGQQEAKPKNMSFQDFFFFFTIKSPWRWKISLPGVK